MIVSLENIMPVIKKSLAEGRAVRFASTGGSMVPFIYNGDEIELIPPVRNINKSDIVLLEKETDKYVLHRVVKIKDGNVYLRGDAQNNSEGPFNTKSIIGIAKLSFHKGNERNHLISYWHFAGCAWIFFFPFTVFIYDIYRFSRRNAGSFLRKLQIIR